ncbi:shikimate kinase [Desulfatiglans anilini]|uniref:shikimate kinase n=1 Tax=Desulfatiglans anilini TaxID=90728 RepID=UPI0003F7B791|nr:shikimate kinase [Desulfatiglans anilini]
MNIVLIGYRCSGKSTIGSLLAERLNRPFFDTDRAIEDRMERSIQDFIAMAGWASFRNAERRTIQGLAGMDDLVIATGGGVVLDPQNISDLRANGWVVWLKADAAAIRRRMQQDPDAAICRPPLAGGDACSEIERVLEARTALYESACDCALDATSRSPQAIADEILALLPWNRQAGETLPGRSDLPEPVEKGSRHAR